MSAVFLLDLLTLIAMIYFAYCLLTMTFQQVDQKNNFKNYIAHADLLTDVERQEIATVMVDEETIYKKKMRSLLLIGFGVIVLLCILAFFAQTTFNLIYVIFALFLCIVVASLIYKAMIFSRNNQFIKQLPSAINMLVHYTLANISLIESFQLLCKQLPKPLVLFFQKVSEKIAGGATFATALRDSARPYKLFQLDYLVIILILQQETGVDTVKILRRLENWLRKEQVLDQKVKNLKVDLEVAQWIVALAVLFMLVVQMILVPDRVHAFLSSSLGRMLFIIGIVLYIIGVFLIRRVMKVV